MKKKGYVIAIAILLIFGALVWFREPIAQAGVGAFGLLSGPSNASLVGNTISTSTLDYLTPGTGTTSILINTAGTDQLDVNIFMVASSTLTDLRWRVEFSHSTTTVPALQEWFPETVDLADKSSATTTNATILAEHQWVFASTTPHRIGTSTPMNGVFDQDTTGSRRFSLKDINARWTRLEFYIPAGSAASIGPSTTALGIKPAATSTNAGIKVQPLAKQPL